MSAPPQSTETGVGALVAERLREQRRELGMKLADVAAAAGVSTGYLSAIENGGSLPSLPVLARLAHALGLSLAEMLRSSASERLARGRMTESLGAKSLAVEGSHLQIVRLSRKPGARGRAPLALGGTDVFVFVHQGALHVDVDGAGYELGPGDALHCDRPKSVVWSTVGTVRSVSLWAAANGARTRRP